MGNRWGNSGNSVRLYLFIYFFGSNVTADGDCSHEIKRRLFLWRKVMTKLDRIEKQRHYFANKGPSSQGYVFSSSHVWLWELEYKDEHWRIDAFELWRWRRLLRVPWTARESKQSILKEISPENSLEGLMLKLKLQYLAIWCKELTHWKRPWCWERLKVGGEEDDRGWDGWMASPTRWTWVWASSRSWWWTGKPGCCSPWGHKEWTHWVTELNWCFYLGFPGGALRFAGAAVKRYPTSKLRETQLRW